jgi:hypothetical protein
MVFSYVAGVRELPPHGFEERDCFAYFLRTAGGRAVERRR